MIERGDKSHFEKIWQNKMEQDQLSVIYKVGDNLRVDKALEIIPSGTYLLDIGCGSGMLASQLAGKYKEAHGIDIAEGAVSIARQKGVLARVSNLNTDPLPYENGFFDTLTILSTLQYIYDLDFALQECYRVLKPEGEIYISIPNMRTFWRLSKLVFLGIFPLTSLDQVGLDGGTLHYFCYRNLVELLKKHGFETVAYYGIYCKPKFFQFLPDHHTLGIIKREFFSAEILVKAKKRFSNIGH